jgi:hypothetical protein
MPAPIHSTAEGIDFTPRFVRSNTVVGSPALAAETVVAATPVFPAGFDAAVVVGVLVIAQSALTVGTSGTAITYRIRTGATAGAGTIIFTSGATTAGIAAANLLLENMIGIDPAPAALSGQQYCLTVQVTGGAAASTVSAVSICALAL